MAIISFAFVLLVTLAILLVALANFNSMGTSIDDINTHALLPHFAGYWPFPALVVFSSFRRRQICLSVQAALSANALFR